MTLNAPMNQQALRLVTLCAYFPGCTRDVLMRFLDIDRADQIAPILDDLMRRGYLRRSRHNFGGFETALDEWDPSRDVRADTMQCNDHRHPTVDEEPPVRLVD